MKKIKMSYKIQIIIFIFLLIFTGFRVTRLFENPYYTACKEMRNHISYKDLDFPQGNEYEIYDYALLCNRDGSLKIIQNITYSDDSYFRRQETIVYPLHHIYRSGDFYYSDEYAWSSDGDVISYITGENTEGEKYNNVRID